MSGSFAKCDGTDFGGIDFAVHAVDKSEIYLHHCLNSGALDLTMPINTRSSDLSIIYSHAATGLQKTDLAWVGAARDGKVTNTSGSGFTIPGATKYVGRFVVFNG